MDPFDKTKSQGDSVAGGVAPSTSGLGVGSTPVEEPVVPSGVVGTGSVAAADDSGVTSSPTAMAGQTAAQVKTPEPEVSAPPVPPVAGSAVAGETPAGGSTGSMADNDEPLPSAKTALDETSTSPLGQTPAIPGADESEDSGGGTGTGLTGV